MNKIVQDWNSFCEGNVSFDKSHFFSLFWEDITQNELKEVFKYFPNSDKLFQLTYDYLFGSIDNSLKLNDKLIIDLALNDVGQKKLLLSENDLLYAKISNFKVEFVQNMQTVQESKQDSPYIDFFDAISDIILNSWIIEDKKTFALYEAFYGLTNHYELVWYLFSPLLNVNITFEYYYKLIINGGMYSFLDNKLIISSSKIS